ncbi:MAG: msfA [Polaromonas sp.]|nr:msfA [Polaromonas sp.]
MTYSATRLITSLLLTALVAAPLTVHAGLNEGLAAYDKADYATALKELTPLAEKGNAQAQYRLGKIFNLGAGLPPNKMEAAKWIQMAAQQGLAEAQGTMGYLYLVGEGVVQNNELAVKWTRKAAEQGDATAQFNLSTMHSEKFGIKKNPAESLKWLRKAADQRHVQAMNTLGALYEKGQAGVKQNPVLAYMLFDASAEKGDSAAAARQKALEKNMSASDIRAGKDLARKWKPGTSLTKVLASGASF